MPLVAKTGSCATVIADVVLGSKQLAEKDTSVEMVHQC